MGSSLNLLSFSQKRLKCMLELYASEAKSEVLRSILEVYSSYYENLSIVAFQPQTSNSKTFLQIQSTTLKHHHHTVRIT